MSIVTRGYGQGPGIIVTAGYGISISVVELLVKAVRAAFSVRRPGAVFIALDRDR